MAMDFGDALVAIKAGRRVARRIWSDTGMYIRQAYFPAPGNVNKESPPGGLVPPFFSGTPDHPEARRWNPLAPDFWATDWHVVVEAS